MHVANCHRIAICECVVCVWWHTIIVSCCTILELYANIIKVNIDNMSNKVNISNKVTDVRKDNRGNKGIISNTVRKQQDKIDNMSNRGNLGNIGNKGSRGNITTKLTKVIEVT